MASDPFQAPRQIPPTIYIPATTEQPIGLGPTSLEDPNNDLFKRNVEMTVVRPV
jgi:hypothetical protein